MACNKKIIFRVCCGCLLVVTIAVFIFAFWKSKSSIDSCTLPNNKAALCVPIDTCKTMNTFLNESKLAFLDKREIFGRHLCGSETNKTKLCCPREPILDVLDPEEDVLTTCTLPNNVSANCTPVKMCQSIISALRSGTLNKSQRDSLRQYQCLTTGNSMHVCCPSELHMAETEEEATPTTAPTIVLRNTNLLPTECGIALPVLKITGGERARLYEFPWMAILSYQTDREGVVSCSGTIINNKYILTAAHCIYNHTVLGVRVGEYDLSSSPRDCERFGSFLDCAPPVQNHAIEDVIVHSEYVHEMSLNDIALIRLQNQIVTNNNTQPICLPMISDLMRANLTGSLLVVTGWGITTNLRDSSQVLLRADIPVISEDDCQQRLRNTPRVILPDRQICSHAKNGADSCKGDSGGPVQGFEYLYEDMRYVQFGIVSYGPRWCGRDKLPSVYTRIDYYMDWILSNLRP